VLYIFGAASRSRRSRTRMIAATVRRAGCAVRRGGASAAQCGSALALNTDHAARRARCAAIVQWVRRALQIVSSAPAAGAGPPCGTVQCQCSAPRIRELCRAPTGHCADRTSHSRPRSAPTGTWTDAARQVWNDRSKLCVPRRAKCVSRTTDRQAARLAAARFSPLLGGAGCAREPVLHSMFSHVPH
jgi:hypothetical protein